MSIADLATFLVQEFTMQFENGDATARKLMTDPLIVAALLKQFNLLAALQCMPGGMLSASSNGNDPETGIVWANLPAQDYDAVERVVPGRLVAFRASPANGHLQELWRSDRDPGNASARGRRPLASYFLFAKYNYPTIANGKVYLATFSNQVNVYGISR
jgi:hypothetical protein